jgi:hypothetical protein
MTDWDQLRTVASDLVAALQPTARQAAAV